MDLHAFKHTLDDGAPPGGLSRALHALWHEARGEWDAAHALVQPDESDPAAWVHAYLHRKEGDPSNAAYWYRRAGQPVAVAPFDDEWEAIAGALLSAEKP